MKLAAINKSLRRCGLVLVIQCACAGLYAPTTARLMSRRLWLRGLRDTLADAPFAAVDELDPDPDA